MFRHSLSFYFQEIKNGINQGSAEINLADAVGEAYLTGFKNANDDYIEPPISFSFDDATIITAYQNTPNYKAIKNDIIAWGK